MQASCMSEKNKNLSSRDSEVSIVATREVVKLTAVAVTTKQRQSMTAMFILLRFGILESRHQEM